MVNGKACNFLHGLSPQSNMAYHTANASILQAIGAKFPAQPPVEGLSTGG
jgi:hypothetical protein